MNRTSGHICRKKQNNYEPELKFRNFPNESLEKAEVLETAKIGHLVSIISVIDPDVEGKGRALVNITDGNGDKHFRLDSVGDVHIVRVAGKLDKETTNQYNLTVQVEDRGTPPKTSTATLVVNVPSKKFINQNIR